MTVHFGKNWKLNQLITVVKLTALFCVSGWGVSLSAQVVEPTLDRVVDSTRQVRDHIEREVADQVQRREIIQNLPLVHEFKDTPVLSVPDLNAVSELAVKTPILTVQGDVAFVEIILPDGSRAIEREWLVHADKATLEALQQSAVTVTARQELTALDLYIVRFRVPESLDSKSVLLGLLPESAANTLARHHVYLAQSKESSSSSNAFKIPQRLWCSDEVKIGMVDTAIETQHETFAAREIIERSFVDATLAQPNAHGTAVAGLLVGVHDQFEGLLPGAKLYNGAVFYRQNAIHQGAPLLPLLEALNWLAQEQVGVINLSLTGPANPLLERAVAQLEQNNIFVVAAAGNDGPYAGAAYPAAYDSVIAVTAVDEDGDIYRWANQGDYIDFSARGVQVTTARRNGQIGYESGTSMAAPVASAALACLRAKQPQWSLQQTREALVQEAIDKGQQGHDPVYGHGLLIPQHE